MEDMSEMQCRNCRELIVEYVEVSHCPQPSAVQAHLDQCPQCARFAADMQTTMQAVRQLPSLDAPLHFSRTVSVRVAATRQVSRRRVWVSRVFSPSGEGLPALHPREALLGVAALAILVLVLAVAFQQLSLPGQSASGMVADNLHWAPDGGGLMPGGQAVSFSQRQMLQHHQDRLWGTPLQHSPGDYLLTSD